MTRLVAILVGLAACAAPQAQSAPSCPCSNAAGADEVPYPSGAAHDLAWLAHRWEGNGGDRMAWFQVGPALIGATLYSGGSLPSFTTAVIVDRGDRRELLFTLRGESEVLYTGASGGKLEVANAEREFPASIAIMVKKGGTAYLTRTHKPGGDGPAHDDFEKTHGGDDPGLLEADRQLVASATHDDHDACLAAWAADGHAFDDGKRVDPATLCQAMSSQRISVLHSDVLGGRHELGITVGRWQARGGASGGYLRVWRLQDSGDWGVVYQQSVVDPD